MTETGSLGLEQKQKTKNKNVCTFVVFMLFFGANKNVVVVVVVVVTSAHAPIIYLSSLKPSPFYDTKVKLSVNEET